MFGILSEPFPVMLSVAKELQPEKTVSPIVATPVNATDDRCVQPLNALLPTFVTLDEGIVVK